VDRRLRSLLDTGAFLIGFALILPVLIGGTITGGGVATGLHVSLVPQPSTVLDIQPAKKHWHQTLRPSSSRDGLHLKLTAYNATGAELAVTLRTAYTSHAVDDMLQIHVSSRGRQVFDGTLGELRRGARLGTLESHRRLTMEMVAWLPPGKHGYVAQIARIPLTFDGLPPAGA
jgi:hypothetical protein